MTLARWKAEQREFRKALEAGAEPTVTVAAFRRWATLDTGPPRSIRDFMFRNSKSADGWLELLGVYPLGCSPGTRPFAVVTLAVHDAKRFEQHGEVVIVSDPQHPRCLALLTSDDDALWPLVSPRAATEFDPVWE